MWRRYPVLLYINIVSTYRVNMEAVTIVGATYEEVQISTTNREQHIIQVASNIPPVWYWFGVDNGDLRKLWCIIPPVPISCILYKNCNAPYCQCTSPEYYMYKNCNASYCRYIFLAYYTKNCNAPYCQYMSPTYYTKTVMHHTASTCLPHIIQKL